MAAKSATKTTGVTSVQSAQIYTRINSLLYTLRSIAQREDQLCMLMHHLRTTGKLSNPLAAELHEILDEIPTEEYLHDLHALRTSLERMDAGGPAATRPARTRSTGKTKAA